MTATPTTNLSYQNFFQATLTADITASATDIFLDTVPNGSEGFLVIDPDNSSLREVIYYNSKTALKVTCPSAADGRGQGDTSASAHLSGTTVIMAPIAEYFESLQSLFTTSPQGWTSLSGSVTGVTANGNRSYDLTVDTDQTAVLSPGMRLRTTRTVSAPTQCTSLNGTNQYYSKSSPSGMTFTDDFVVSAWVKLSSYPTSGNGYIVSRYNGTSGWSFFVSTSGQVTLGANNAGASNFSVVTSYQSIPLNRWVHISAQLDMSAFTATTTTSYIMLDGVDIPSFVTRSGTNPTALVQAGDLNIGSYNNGAASSFFPGKIAQAAVFSAKVTQATMRGYMSQGLAGTETSLISAYSFNNSINDLTANANNLTANGSAVATNADSPFGGQADGTISATRDYGIVSKVTASTITVNVAEGCTIPTTGGVSAVSYSTYRAPYGFPGDSGKWQILMQTNARGGKGSPASGSTYNTADQIYLPIGAWVAGYKTTVYVSNSTAATLAIYSDLNSTAVTGPWPASGTLSKTSRFAAATYINSITEIGPSHYVRVPLNVSTATQYWLTFQPTSSAGSLLQVGPLSDFAPTIIFADNAYL